MAGKRRHWKKHNGRFWARIAIPIALRPFFSGKTELTEPLGGDMREADRKHAAAVARLQAQIQAAADKGDPSPIFRESGPQYRPLSVIDQEHLVWGHYSEVLQIHEQKRAAMPTQAEIGAELDLIMQRSDAGEIDGGRDPIGMINAQTDYELKLAAREHDKWVRQRRQSALKRAIAADETTLVDDAVAQYVSEQKLHVAPGSADWRLLAQIITRAEIEALLRSFEQDDGDYGGKPSDPLVRPPSTIVSAPAPVSLKRLFSDYISTRQAIGKHRDGGATWKSSMDALGVFLGHDDALRITRRNLLDWRDALMADGTAAKSVSDKHLAAIKAVLKWAFDNDRLPSNEAKSVRQEVPKKQHSRPKGYTDKEAVAILKVSLNYTPRQCANPSNRESQHMSAAKKWVPLLGVVA